jgi:hypothetical protein
MSSEKEPRSKRKFRYLPLTLSIETLGGIATPLVLRGTPLPASRSKVFSTASDNQEAVEIKVMMGESPIAARNLHVASFTLSGIPQARRAEPRIVVNFEVDQECKVKASAVEKTSDSKIVAESEDAQPHLSDHEIRQLLQEAETHRTEDQKLLKLVEANNRAEEVISKTEARLQKRQELSLWSEQDGKIEQALAALGLTLESDNPEEIRAKAEELERLIQYQEYPFQTYPASPFAGGFDDLFPAIFGGLSTAEATSRRESMRAAKAQPPTKDTMSKRASPEEGQPTDKLTASKGMGDQIGKIFGGGEFTLDPNLCFVLMPFAEQMRPIYDDHIRPIVESEELSCLRADEIMGTNVITWDIWEKVNRARFIIADLTGRNSNVFYEVGIAHTLGKEVILLTQSMNDVPFDLKALRCIVYSYTPRGMRDMEKKLRYTIKEIMRSS